MIKSLFLYVSLHQISQTGSTINDEVSDWIVPFTLYVSLTPEERGRLLPVTYSHLALVGKDAALRLFLSNSQVFTKDLPDQCILSFNKLYNSSKAQLK